MSKQWKRDLFAINVHGNAYNVGDEIEFRIWESTDGKTNISVDGEVLDAEKIAEIGQGGGGGEVIENIEEALDLVSNQLTPYDITDVVDYWPSDGCGVQPESPWGPVDWEVEYSVQGQTVVEYKLPNTLIYDNAIFTQTYTGSEFTHFIDPDGKVEITIIHNDQTEQDYIYAIDNYNDYWADFVTDSDFLTTRGFHDIVINSPSSDYADAYVEDHGTTWKCWIEDFNVELTYDRNAEIWKGIAEDEYATEVVFNIWDDVTLDDDTIIFQGDFDLRNKLGYCYTPLIEMAQDDTLADGYSGIPSWEIVEGSNEPGQLIDCETMIHFCDLPHNIASMDDTVRGYFNISYDAWNNLDPSTESPQEIGTFNYKDEYGTAHEYIVYFQQDLESDPIEIKDIQNDITRNYVPGKLTFVAAPEPEPTDTTVDLGTFNLHDTFNFNYYTQPVLNLQNRIQQPAILIELDLNSIVEDLCGDLSRGIQFLSNKYVTFAVEFADLTLRYGSVPVMKKDGGITALVLDDAPNNDIYSHYQAHILVDVIEGEQSNTYNYYLVLFNDTINIMPEIVVEDTPIERLAAHKFLGISSVSSSVWQSRPSVLYTYLNDCLLRNINFKGYQFNYDNQEFNFTPVYWQCGKGETTLVTLPYYVFNTPGEISSTVSISDSIPLKFNYIWGEAYSEVEGNPLQVTIEYEIYFNEYVPIDSTFTLDYYLNLKQGNANNGSLMFAHKETPYRIFTDTESYSYHQDYYYMNSTTSVLDHQPLYYMCSNYNPNAGNGTLFLGLLKAYWDNGSNGWAHDFASFEGLDQIVE